MNAKIVKAIKENNFDIIFKKLKEISKKSDCLHSKVAALAVSMDKKKFTFGFNKTVEGFKTCKTINMCTKEALGYSHGEGHEFCMAVHAEANAIAKTQFNLNNGILYCTHKPCRNCAKLIVSSGIKEVYYKNDYPDLMSTVIFDKAKIKCIKVK